MPLAEWRSWATSSTVSINLPRAMCALMPHLVLAKYCTMSLYVTELPLQAWSVAVPLKPTCDLSSTAVPYFNSTIMPKKTASASDTGPACYACIVDPQRGINQHRWLVQTAKETWQSHNGTHSVKNMAKLVAHKFEEHFGTNERKVFYSKKKPIGEETDEQRDLRCQKRPVVSPPALLGDVQCLSTAV